MIAIGTCVRLRPEYLYLLGSLPGSGRNGRVADRWVADLGGWRGTMPMLRIFRDGESRSEEWSENMWEPIE
mgnify:CR=1 FL=1